MTDGDTRQPERQGKATRRKRRWFQVSLRTFLAVMLLAGAGLGWLGMKMDRARRQKSTVDLIREGDPFRRAWLAPPVRYEESNHKPPDWLRKWFGEDFFYDVHAVRIWSSEFAAADLERLKVLTELRELSIDGPPLTDDCLANLRGMTKLERLDIHTGFVDRSGPLLQIWTLPGDRPPHPQITDDGLMHLRHLHALMDLTFASDNVTDAGLVHLEDLTNLQHLHLVCPQVTDAGVIHLTKLSRLQKLELRGIRIRGSGLSVLSELPALEEVIIGGQVLSGGDIRLELSREDGVVRLSDLRFEGESKVYLPAGLHHEWSCHELSISETGRVALMGTSKMDSLCFFRIELAPGAQLCFEALDTVTKVKFPAACGVDAVLPSLRDLPALKILELSWSDISVAGLQSLPRLDQLAELHLDGVGAIDMGLMRIQEFGALQVLHLNGSRVTDAGLADLAGSESLRELYLSYTGVGDAGLAHLERLGNLRRLDLHSTSITDAGLARLAKLSKLQWLDLNNTPITDAGLQHIAGLTQLQTLILVRTQVTSAGIKKLQASLPNCDVVQVAP